MMTLERRHDLITVLKPYFLPKRLHSTKSYFIKAIDHTFYGFTGMITHLGCWENTRKACKSRAEGEEARVVFRSLVCALDSEMFVFIDESGFVSINKILI